MTAKDEAPLFGSPVRGGLDRPVFHPFKHTSAGGKEVISSSTGP